MTNIITAASTSVISFMININVHHEYKNEECHIHYFFKEFVSFSSAVFLEMPGQHIMPGLAHSRY